MYFNFTKKLLPHNQFHEFSSPSERQALVGPPESMREHVVAASKAMRNGDWRKCRDFIINSKMNAKVWDLFYEADKVREMLSRKIQEETLRTYLFTYSKVYNSISIVSTRSLFIILKNNKHTLQFGFTSFLARIDFLKFSGQIVYCKRSFHAKFINVLS